MESQLTISKKIVKEKLELLKELQSAYDPVGDGLTLQQFYMIFEKMNMFNMCLISWILTKMALSTFTHTFVAFIQHPLFETGFEDANQEILSKSNKGDENGLISIDNLLHFLQKLAPFTNKDIETQFEEADDDHDSLLSLKEVQYLFKKVNINELTIL